MQRALLRRDGSPLCVSKTWRARTCRNVSVLAGAKGRQDWEDSATSFIDRVMGTGPSNSPAPTKKASSAAAVVSSSSKTPLGNGTLILLAANFAIFALDKLAHMSWIPQLYFWGARAQWWQFVSSAFCHADFHHLASNMFLLYVFGKTVEDEEGAVAVVSSYFICAFGSCLASMWLAPKTVLLGASGACFGLFIISAVLKLKFNLRSLLELAAITPFVYEQVTSNIVSHLGGGVGQISHVGHLGGAAAGLLLCAILSLLPADE